MLYPHIPETLHGGTGFGCKGIEILLSLSSRYLLIIRERTHFAPLMRPVVEEPDGVVLHLRPEGVALYNSLQIASSFRWIYSSTNEFAHVQELIKRFPELINPERSRFSASG